MHEIKKHLHMVICLVIVCSFILMGCPNGGDPPNDDGNDNPGFSWSDPESEIEGSSIDISAGEDISSRARELFRTINISDEGPGSELIPDSLSAGFSYIALITDEVICDMRTQNLYGRETNDGDDQGKYPCDPWSEEDLTQYTGNGNMDHFPGINTSHYPNTDPFDPTTTSDAGMVQFIGFVDDARTPLDIADVTDGAFVLFDGRDDDTIKEFDLSEKSFSLQVEDMPDPGTYTGVAFELVYYEAYFEDFGFIRMYYNEHDDGTDHFYAGDFVTSRTTPAQDRDWEWTYLKHGDGPDVHDGSVVATVSDGGYDQVESPDDPTLGYSAGKSYKAYDGQYTLTGYLSGNTLPVFVVDPDMDYWITAAHVDSRPNWEKRPVSSVSCMYIGLPTEMMNGNNMQDIQYVKPYIADDDYTPGEFGTLAVNAIIENNLGGYGNYNAANPEDSTPFDLGNLTGDAVIRGHADMVTDPAFDVDGWKAAVANVIYHEDDAHLGDEDFSKPLYLDARLSADRIVTREELRDEFGNYAYDSGVITHVYDDSRVSTTYRDNELKKIAPTLLDMAMGRLCVMGQRFYDTQEGTWGYEYAPTDGGDYSSEIIEVQIELLIDVDLRFGEDCLDRDTTIAGVDIVEADEFDRRFLSFMPNVVDPNDEYGTYWLNDTEINAGATAYDLPPIQKGFYGTDGNRLLQTDLSFSMNYFSINATNRNYYDVFSRAPDLHPDPLEGPFDEGLEITASSDNEDTRFFYTTDGSEPAVTLNESLIPVIDDAGTTTELTTGNSIPIDFGDITTVTMVAFSEKKDAGVGTGEYKRASMPVVGTYTFTEPGKKISGSISLTAPDETPVFVGLFTNDTVSLNAEMQPAYSVVVTISSNTANYELKDIPSGTYYLCIIADIDENSGISGGDKAYPGIDAADDTLLDTAALTIGSTDVTHSVGAGETWDTL